MQQAKPSNGSPERPLTRALRLLTAHRRDAGGAFLALIVVSAANLAAPQLIRLALDGGVEGHQSQALALAVVGLLGVAFVRGVFTFLQGYLAERASQGVAYDLRERLYSQIERLGFAYYDQVQTGQLVTRLTSDVEQIRGFVGGGVVQAGAAAVMLTGSMVLLFNLNWRLALVSLATIPAIFFVLYRFVVKVRPLFTQVQQTVAQLNTILQEALVGRRVVRAFVREPFELERYSQTNALLLEKNLTAIYALADSFPLIFFITNLGTLAVIGYGGFEVIGGRLSVGELVAFNSYLALLLFPVLSLGFLGAGIARAGASAARVFEILDAVPGVADAPAAVALGPVRGAIEFEAVHFRYPGSEQEILTDLSFRIEPGQTVALLGSTGSGKSTVVSLIARFYDASAGVVRIDGQDVRAVTLASLRSQIGVVLQETLLFSGTVRDNIAFGRPDADETAIVRAARLAQADEFIQELPAGYDTVVGERGVGLSGGQRQRIAIARTLLVEPRILILDDSTSAVDATTEAAIRRALEALMGDRERTVLVVAQRISTVRGADLVLVLDEGRLAAMGTHAQLAATSPLYVEILGSQLAGEPVTSAGGQP